MALRGYIITILSSIKIKVKKTFEFIANPSGGENTDVVTFLWLLLKCIFGFLQALASFCSSEQ